MSVVNCIMYVFLLVVMVPVLLTETRNVIDFCRNKIKVLKMCWFSMYYTFLLNFMSPGPIHAYKRDVRKNIKHNFYCLHNLLKGSSGLQKITICIKA